MFIIVAVDVVVVVVVIYTFHLTTRSPNCTFEKLVINVDHILL